MTNGLTDNEAKWIRKIWISYWAIIALHATTQLAAWLFLPYQATAAEFYLLVLLKPTLAMSAAAGAGWLVGRIDARLTFYALIASGTVIALTIIRMNTDIRIISALFLLPIFVSILFFRVRLTMYAAALQAAAFVLIYFRDGSYRSYLSPFDLIAIPCFIGMCALIAAIIMIRGQELQKELYTAMSAKHELMEQYAALRRQAKIDELTGLYNQASFREHFRLALDYAGGETHPPFQLALMDIDDFKAINDTYGHRTGDLVLEYVAKAVREHTPANGIAARYGGEEFALLLFEASVEDAAKVCETIRLAVSRILLDAVGGKPVTVSTGVAAYEAPMQPDELFEQADARLYLAKRSGKNRTVSLPA